MLTGYTASCMFVIFVPTRGRALVLIFSWYQKLLSQLPCVLLSTEENDCHRCSEFKPAAHIGRSGIQLWCKNLAFTCLPCMMVKHLLEHLGRGVPSPSVSFLSHNWSSTSKLSFHHPPLRPSMRAHGLWRSARAGKGVRTPRVRTAV